jgi:alpha-amylase
MRTLLDGTLMKEMPLLAVTLVENHDTQPLQALECYGGSRGLSLWPMPSFCYGQRATPVCFYADYYGADYTDRGR